MISSINNKCSRAWQTCAPCLTGRLFGHMYTFMWAGRSLVSVVPLPRAWNRGARFHAVSTSCLWRCLPPNHDFRPITSLTGNPRCHIGFQQDIRRGASLLTAETAAGKAGTLFPGCATPSPWLLHKYWSNFQNTLNAVALLKPWRHFLLPWWQIMGSICTAESNRKWHFIAGRWLLRHPEPHHNNNYWRDAVT